MSTVYQRYYRICLMWAIAWRYAATAAAVCALLWVTGCAAQPKTPEYLNARAECERNAAPSRGLVMATIYNHCMQARGYK